MLRRIAGMTALCAACALGAPAFATHYVVDLNGGGDFTAIQAAIDAQAVTFRDTIQVMPGEYADSLVLPCPSRSQYLLGTLGARVTSLRTVRFPPGGCWDGSTTFEGLAFNGDLPSVPGFRSCYFQRCTFRGRVLAYGEDGKANFEDCDFYGRTFLDAYIGYPSPDPNPTGLAPFQRLRFHGAPLSMTTVGSGPSALKDCLFEGPADTLLFANGGTDPVTMDDCVFQNARIGVVYPYNSVYPDRIARCVFDSLTDFGVLLDDSQSPHPWGNGITVIDSRFNSCGTSIRWMKPSPGGGLGLTLVRDTLLASRNNAVEVSDVAHLDSSIVAGSGGHGVALLHAAGAGALPGKPTLTNSSFVRNHGDGVNADASGRTIVGQSFMNYQVSGSTFAMNGGAGLRILGVSTEVRDNVSFANGGDGFAFSTPSPEWRADFESNSSVLNHGDGFSLAALQTAGDSQARIEHNLAAMNAGAGMRVPNVPSGSLAFNDAYENYVDQYVGPASPADSNLTVDPRFCDLSAGLAGLGLQQGSPCGPSGVYGLIGARGEECANVAAAPPATPGAALAFSVRPSVARRSVEFVAPAGGSEGRVEVYDLAGRVLWRAPLGTAATTVRWNGEGERGRVRAGLYWVRFTRGPESATQRLVWLE